MQGASSAGGRDSRQSAPPDTWHRTGESQSVLKTYTVFSGLQDLPEAPGFLILLPTNSCLGNPQGTQQMTRFTKTTSILWARPGSAVPKQGWADSAKTQQTHLFIKSFAITLLRAERTRTPHWLPRENTGVKSRIRGLGLRYASGQPRVWSCGRSGIRTQNRVAIMQVSFLTSLTHSLF